MGRWLAAGFTPMPAKMTLLLSNEDVEAALQMPDCLEAMEIAYRDLGEMKGRNGLRSEILTPTARDDALRPRSRSMSDRLNEPRVTPRTLAGATILQIVPALREEPNARTALNVAYTLLQAGARALDPDLAARGLDLPDRLGGRPEGPEEAEGRCDDLHCAPLAPVPSDVDLDHRSSVGCPWPHRPNKRSSSTCRP